MSQNLRLKETAYLGLILVVERYNGLERPHHHRARFCCWRFGQRAYRWWLAQYRRARNGDSRGARICRSRHADSSGRDKLLAGTRWPTADTCPTSLRCLTNNTLCRRVGGLPTFGGVAAARVRAGNRRQRCRAEPSGTSVPSILCIQPA